MYRSDYDRWKAHHYAAGEETLYTSPIDNMVTPDDRLAFIKSDLYFFDQGLESDFATYERFRYQPVGEASSDEHAMFGMSYDRINVAFQVVTRTRVGIAAFVRFVDSGGIVFRDEQAG